MLNAIKQYLKCQTLNDAISFARDNKGKMRYMAGGTDVMVNKFQGNDPFETLIDISAIVELKQVTATNDQIKIGPLISLKEIANNHFLNSVIPQLCVAAKSVGSPLIRESATIGGNLLCENRCLYYNQSEWWRDAIGNCLKCNGDICIATGGKNACFSEFISDTAPVLIAYDTELQIVNSTGQSRVCKLRDIYSGDGVNPRLLSNDDLITEIIIKNFKSKKCAFRKLRLRQSLDFTSLTVSVSIDKDAVVRISIGGMDPKPIYFESNGNSDPKALTKQLLKLCRSVDNDFFSRNYRRKMLGVFIEECFNELGIYE